MATKQPLAKNKKAATLPEPNAQPKPKNQQAEGGMPTMAQIEQAASDAASGVRVNAQNLGASIDRCIGIMGDLIGIIRAKDAEIDALKAAMNAADPDHK